MHILLLNSNCDTLIFFELLYIIPIRPVILLIWGCRVATNITHLNRERTLSASYEWCVFVSSLICNIGIRRHVYRFNCKRDSKTITMFGLATPCARWSSGYIVTSNIRVTYIHFIVCCVLIWHVYNTFGARPTFNYHLRTLWHRLYSKHICAHSSRQTTSESCSAALVTDCNR